MDDAVERFLANGGQIRSVGAREACGDRPFHPSQIRKYQKGAKPKPDRIVPLPYITAVEYQGPLFKRPSFHRDNLDTRW